jgi:uncharacterized membrane protein YjjP (DUF1212 family)
MDVKNKLVQIPFDKKCYFIIKIGKAAHKYGTPVIRLEAYLKTMSQTFGLESEFHSSPGNLVFAFRENEEKWQKIDFASGTSSLDLTKLLELDEIRDDVVAGNINIEDAESRINEVDGSPDPYGKILIAFSYLVSGAGIAGLFSGSWVDILFSSILSLVVFAMVWLSSLKGGWVNRMVPLTTAFVAGGIAAVLKHFIPELNYVLVTLSAIIVLIPGYSVSLGVIEMVNNHIISGLTNMTNGVVSLFKQFIGAWLAISIVIAFWAVPSATSRAIDSVWLWAFVPAFIIGLILIFQTPPRYFLWAFASCLLGYLGVTYGSEWMGSNIGNLIGAVLVGVFANTWEWKTGRPGAIVSVPAITVLVGGSIGFRGLMATAQGQSDGSSEFIQMFIIALTLAAGIAIANIIVKPSSSL